MKRKLSLCEITRSDNKIIKISQLIQDYMEESNSDPIIQHLKNWLSQVKDGQQSTEELALILIKNYLNPSTNIASWHMKLALPNLFNKQELIDLLENIQLSQDEKANFKDIYLKNVVEKFKLDPTFNFFAAPKDINKIILSNFSTEELIKSITTSKQVQLLNFEILFERTDKLAMKFQSKILEKWAKILIKKQSLDELFSADDKKNWFVLIQNYLTTRENHPFESLIYSTLLLKYFNGANFESLKTYLDQIITKEKSLPAPKTNYYLKNQYEMNRISFLHLCTQDSLSKEMIDYILDGIKTTGYETKAKYDFPPLINYKMLRVCLADLDADQLNLAILSLFKRAFGKGSYSDNPSLELLKYIMKQLAHLPENIQMFYMDKIKYYNINDSKSDVQANDFAFLLVLEHAKFNNPAILEELLKLAVTKFCDEKIRGLHWISQLTPHLTLDDNLISKILENLSSCSFHFSDTYKMTSSLKQIVKQLTDKQLAKYSYQCLALLYEENSIAATLLGIFIAPFSHCPHELIQNLVDLTYKNESISRIARQALMQLEPNILVIQKGILEKELNQKGIFDQCVRSEYIIKLFSLISSKDISTELIQSLFTMRLCKNSLATIGLKFNEQQLKDYIDYSLLQKRPELAHYLMAIPSSQLNGKIDSLIEQYSTQLDSHNYNIQKQACCSIQYFEKIYDILPQSLLVSFVNVFRTMLDDVSYSVQNDAAKILPKIVPFIHQKEYIQQVYKLFLENLSAEWTLGRVSRQCISLIASKLSPEELQTVQYWLIENSDYGSLIGIAKYLESEKLKALIKTLANKADQKSFEYFPSLIKLIPSDSITDVLTEVLNPLLKALESNSSSRRKIACQILLQLEPQANVPMRRKIISGFTNILRNQETDIEEQKNNRERYWMCLNEDRAVVLDGLIGFAGKLTAQEAKTLINLPVTSFKMIATMPLIKTIYEHSCNMEVEENIGEVETKFTS